VQPLAAVPFFVREGMIMIPKDRRYRSTKIDQRSPDGMKRKCVLVVAMLLVACGPKATSIEAGERSPSRSPSAAPTDPLQGEWRQRSTCEEVVRTLRREARPDLFEMWAADVLAGMESASQPPPRSHLCQGAPAMFVLVAKFEDGHVVFFYPPHLQANGINATYQIEGDDTLVVTDCCHNIAPNPLTCTFQIEGDRLMIHARSHDPWTIADFDTAPFVRVT
jgi:hypothetical protein